MKISLIKREYLQTNIDFIKQINILIRNKIEYI